MNKFCSFLPPIFFFYTDKLVFALRANYIGEIFLKKHTWIKFIYFRKSTTYLHFKSHLITILTRMIISAMINGEFTAIHDVYFAMAMDVYFARAWQRRGSESIASTHQNSFQPTAKPSNSQKQPSNLQTSKSYQSDFISWKSTNDCHGVEEEKFVKNIPWLEFICTCW